MNGPSRGTFLRLLQYALALLALGWIVSRTEWSRAVDLLGGVDATTVVALLAVTAVEFVSRFSMWHVLLRGVGSTRFRTAANVDLVVRFVNHLVPSRVAGRSVAPAVVHHFTGFGWSESTAVAAVNTGLYALLYGVVSLVGLLRFGLGIRAGLALVIALSTGLYLFVALAILVGGRSEGALSWMATRVGGVVARVPVVGRRLSSKLSALPAFAAQTAGGLRDLSGRPDVLGTYAVAWAVTLMLVPGVRVWLLLSVFDVPFGYAVWLPVILVTAYSVTLLPITPGGIGVAEASATLVLVALGIPEGIAGAIVLIDRILGVYVPALLGWYPVAELDTAAILGGE